MSSSRVGGMGGGFSGGFSCSTLTTIMKKTMDNMTLAVMRKRGIHICHFEGLRQKSDFAGVQTGGGLSGSAVDSGGSPISVRLFIVKRLVIFKLCPRYVHI